MMTGNKTFTDTVSANIFDTLEDLRIVVIEANKRTYRLVKITFIFFICSFFRIQMFEMNVSSS